MSQGGSEQESRVGYVVKRLQQVLRVSMDTALAEHDLSMAQFAVLKSLQHGPLAAAELARRSFTTRQSMQDVLSCLDARGFIEKAAPQPKGGRSQPVTLTNHGRRVADEADHAVRAVESRMTRGLTPPQQDQLQAWLTTCADNLQHANPR
ncbi:MAG TPA: MarR family transcriptional regulator [Pseudonocardiaceae bacterium]